MSPGSMLYGFGDNTAGAVWRYEVYPNSPFWGYEKMTNYPFGENISSPIYASGLLQYVSYWIGSSVFGSIAAYNLLNVVGLLFSAMMMYFFVLYLLKNQWVAVFAGYAVAFTPYYQMKIGGHPTYAFQGIIIAIIWLFFRIIENHRLRDKIMLGVLVASTVYFDVYFALLAAIVLVALGVVWLIVRSFTYYSERRKKTKNSIKELFTKELRSLGLSAITAFVLVLPILVFFISNHHEITGAVSAARGNVVAEAKACSNWPHEYFVPFVLNPLLSGVFGTDRYQSTVNAMKENFSCGIGEDSVGLGIALGLVGLFAIAVISWEKLNNRKINWNTLIKEKVDYRLVLGGLSAIMVLAIVLSFPPLKFHNMLPTPSYDLLSLTTTWRTLSRIYVVVNIAFVVLVSIALMFFWTALQKRKVLIWAFMLLAFVTAIEYQAFKPFSGNTLSNFSYATDVPSAYKWLKDQSAISAIAEFPMERQGGESDAISYYLSMQVEHKKKLLNSALSNSPDDVVRSGLKNLSDPQTLPVLKALGADAVVAHGITAQDAKSLSDVDVIYSAPQSKFNLLSHTHSVKRDTITVLSLNRVTPATSVITLDKGFVRNTNIISSVIDWRYEAISGSRMSVWNIDNGGKLSQLREPISVCFSAQMSVPEERTRLSLIIDDTHTIDAGAINGTASSDFKVKAKSSIKLVPNNKHNLRVTNLGCMSDD